MKKEENSKSAYDIIQSEFWMSKQDAWHSIRNIIISYRLKFYWLLKLLKITFALMLTWVMLFIKCIPLVTFVSPFMHILTL